MSIERIKGLILDVYDFPKQGVLFKDITPLLQDGQAFRSAIELLVEPFKKDNITKIVGVDSRGFLFAAPAAVLLNAGFVPIRKPGKLPRKAFKEDYVCEYATNSVEMHCDALSPQDNVLLIDDVLATGGTAAAAIKLVRSCGANLKGISFVIELEFLKGRNLLPNDIPAVSLLKY